MNPSGWKFRQVGLIFPYHQMSRNVPRRILPRDWGSQYSPRCLIGSIAATGYIDSRYWSASRKDTRRPVPNCRRAENAALADEDENPDFSDEPALTTRI